jgi:hypothetical protein
MFTTRIDWKAEKDLIKNRLLAGDTLQILAEEYKVSRQRIKQICNKFKINIKSIRTGQRIDRENIALHEKYKKWGEKRQTEPTLYEAQRVKWRAKKANATRQGTEFTLLFSDISWPTHCPVLGFELDYFSDGRQENSISFDRLSTEAGYTAENTRVISWRANRIKNDGSLEEHERIVEYLRRESSI